MQYYKLNVVATLWTYTYAQSSTISIISVGIAQNFDIFDSLQLDSQNLPCQKSVYRCMVKDNDHPSKFFC